MLSENLLFSCCCCFLRSRALLSLPGDAGGSRIIVVVVVAGHQWVKNNLGLIPKTGWSIDPFGHGATVPYLLKASGLTGGTVVQRIHYAWKQWLAERQMGDFLWRQAWDTDGRTDILTHNQPFDIYSIKHSCGPHPQVGYAAC